jgi:hypothetical protein
VPDEYAVSGTKIRITAEFDFGDIPVICKPVEVEF